MAVEAEGGGRLARATEDSHVAWYNDPKVRGWIYQAITLGLIAFAVAAIISNTIYNLEQRKIAQGFGFLDVTAGFDIAISLIDYPKDATYGRALMVGLVNTLAVAAIGIVLATFLGFIVGVARLSKNFVISTIATWYVEVIRNIPLLLQIFFWYFGVLQILPQPRDSIEPVPGWVYLNVRGLFLPQFNFTVATGWMMFLAFVIAIVAAIVIAKWSAKRQEATGQQFPVGLTTVGLIIGLPLVAYIISGLGLTLAAPERTRFNVSGGLTVRPEFVALLVALVAYTAAFIGEIVRAGIMAVSHGQTEAAGALGLRAGQILKLVIIPQAMRVIIPPLTSQYLNLTKNSSLAVAIGYPDLVYVGGTVLNQTGQAIEIVVIWMAIYLTLSLVTSAFMNWYNRRVAIVER